jgi:ADP-ribose pyrophosphatase
MNLEEKKIEREEIYDGTVLHVVKDKVELPNGESSYREFCLHIGAVSVIPVLDDNRVIMERQYRYAHGRVFLEIPGGKLDSEDEDHEEAARRELREETGAVPERIEYLGAMIPSPALIGETIYMYMARGLTIGETDFDEDEFIEPLRIPLEALVQMVLEGKIRDGKTQIAALRAFMMLKQRKDAEC